MGAWLADTHVDLRRGLPGAQRQHGDVVVRPLGTCGEQDLAERIQRQPGLVRRDLLQPQQAFVDVGVTSLDQSARAGVRVDTEQQVRLALQQPGRAVVANGDQGVNCAHTTDTS